MKSWIQNSISALIAANRITFSLYSLSVFLTLCDISSSVSIPKSVQIGAVQKVRVTDFLDSPFIRSLEFHGLNYMESLHLEQFFDKPTLHAYNR
ncbi:hypothetical protein B0I26_10554 [Anoxybacillus vitaminiphilus]|uniref:Uncharacterized protein n=1 Tax=Paranoxybacillus vitaminiphilus TaxID=581036 RepID=A0A327YHQ6_9BACL|nr:hypothetical protein B0I26_10554 [Anoxybacillus vitaminiphilus]